MNHTKNTIIGCLYAIGCELLFGFSYLFTKQITSQVSPITLLGWRFFIGFLVMSCLIKIGVIKVNLSKKKIKPLLLIALLQPVLYYIGETLGISLTTSSESGSILACIPIATLIFSALILKEKPSKPQIIGITITLIGVLTIVLAKGLTTSLNLAGYAMLFLAIIAYSLYSVYTQKLEGFTSSDITYIMLASGAFFFVVLAGIENIHSHTLKPFLLLPFTNASFAITVLYLGIGCSVLAFSFYNIALTYIGANRAVSFVGISTIVSVIAGVILLKEHYTIYQALGTLLVISGVYTANIGKKLNPLKNPFTDQKQD